MEYQDFKISIREYDPVKDNRHVEAVERACSVGPTGKISIFTDMLGDPLCRVRHSPSFLMLVAETIGPAKEIVGLIRGTIKPVTCGTKSNGAPIRTKLAYILGLRVAPTHRRKGVALKLVEETEAWFKSKGAEYSYVATEKENAASLNLFTDRCGYRRFRSPSILVHPVYAHQLIPPRHVSVFRIPVHDAESLYREKFSNTEFFPHDIDSVLKNPLSLGTFLAVEEGGFEWKGTESFLKDSAESSWAVVSVWNSKDAFRLEVKGVPKLKRGLVKASRAVGRMLPFLKVKAFPNVFEPFGFLFMYGLGGEGRSAAELVGALCGSVHNMGMGWKCELVVTEVGEGERLREGIPWVERLSCEEDVWCLKRLEDEYGDGEVGDWTKAPSPRSIFVDPREF